MAQTRDNLVAEEIADGLLYRTGQALVHGQLDGIEDCFLLPHSVETTEGARIARTADDVRGFFEEVRSYYAETDVVDIVETIVESRFVSDREIESVHVSRVTRRGTERPVSTFPVYSVIKLSVDGKWRIAHCNYAITDSRRHGSAFLSWRAKAET